MTIQEWQLILGAVMSAVMTLGPWMFMVHAKLAVLAARIVDLGEKVEKAAEHNHELWNVSADHATRLKTHDIQFNHLTERLESLS